MPSSSSLYHVTFLSDGTAIRIEATGGEAAARARVRELYGVTDAACRLRLEPDTAAEEARPWGGPAEHQP